MGKNLRQVPMSEGRRKRQESLQAKYGAVAGEKQRWL
jgi:hypothetical protein